MCGISVDALLSIHAYTLSLLISMCASVCVCECAFVVATVVFVDTAAVATAGTELCMQVCLDLRQTQTYTL